MNILLNYLFSFKTKDKTQNIKYNGKKSEEIFNEAAEFCADDFTVLTKKTDKDFVVLNLSDIHFTDYKDIPETAPVRSIPTPLTVARLIKAVKPDFITVTGDIVCGKSTVYSVNHFVSLMERFGIPWAPVFGNHDDEGNCDLNYLADVMLAAPHCLLKKGDVRMGVGNYAVLVKNENGDIENVFIMADSRRKDGDLCGNMNEVQHKWFKWITDGVNKISNGKAECSVFTHIPLPEYINGYEAAFSAADGKWKDSSKSTGHLGEEIACHRDSDGKPVNTGFFEIIKNSKITKNIFCGHDHLNAFSLEYEGIRLNYVMKISKSAGRKFGFDGGLKIVFCRNGMTELDYKTVSYGVMKSAYKIKYRI